MASAGKILIIVENLPVPFDRRVWQEANSLKNEGYEISIICPKGKGYEKKFEIINDIYIYRHSLPFEARRALGYFLEYTCALFWEFVLSLKVYFKRGFDVIHACNPPDLIFLIALFYKMLLKKKFIFDHHDLNPELWLAKGGRKDIFYKLLLLLEKFTFMTADISIATNESYKEIAVLRGGMKKEDVFEVRSAPIIGKFESLIPESPDESIKNGKEYMVGYVGVMGKQDGVDYLLRAIDFIVNRRKRENVFFVIIGDGPEWNNSVKLSKELRLDNFVSFTGRIPDKEMIEYLYACDICVNPDVVNDFNDKSTMNKIIEYMILGKPIVQFDMREGRYSADAASLYAKANDEIDFAKNILKLLDNEPLRKSMGEIGKKRIKDKFSWKNSEKVLLKAYNYLLNS